VKKIWIPFVASLIVLAVLKWSGVQNPIWQFTNDFIIEGYQHASEDFKRNEKIAIVNISDLPDEDIKKQIEIVAKYEPAAIGVDYFSPSESDSVSKKIDFNNIVLPIGIHQDSIWSSGNPYSRQARLGFIQVFSSSHFDPSLKIKGKTYLSLPARLIQLYDLGLYKKLLARENEKEIINYLGQTANFDYLGDLTTPYSVERLKSLKGKIVLVGYTGVESIRPTKTDTLDSHSTPKGKMFGVVVLANIIHTLMGNYIDPLQPAWNYIIVTLLTLLNVFIAIALFPKLRFRYWFIKLFQVVLIFLILVVAAFMMHRFNIYVDYELFVFSSLISPEVAFWLIKIL
jgi:CHASE2 domain-containing sensor protein